MTKINEIAQAVENGKSKVVAGLVEEALKEGAGAPEILNAMIDAMGVVGDKFTKSEVFVPEMLVAAKAMQNGVEVLKPVLAGEGVSSIGKCIIATVKGDLHDIGKNLVAVMIESAGFDVVDLGVDISAEQFIEAIKSNPDVNIVACSALLTTTMPSMRETVGAIKALGIDGLKVIVGGAPITEEFANSVGADAYSFDAAGAAVLAKSLVS